MLSKFAELISVTEYAVESVGVIIILIGSILASIRTAGQLSREPKVGLYRKYRREIGQAMLPGLEFLVDEATFRPQLH